MWEEKTKEFNTFGRAALKRRATAHSPSPEADNPADKTTTTFHHLRVSGDLTVHGRYTGPGADLCEFVEALDPEEAILPGSVVGWRFGKGVTLRTAGAQVGAAQHACS